MEDLEKKELMAKAKEEHQRLIAKRREAGVEKPHLIQKGQALNPGGRQKGVTMRTMLNQLLDLEKIPIWDDGKKKIVMMTRRRALAKRILDQSMVEEKPQWASLAVQTADGQDRGEKGEPVINVNIANFRDMSIEDLLQTAGNPHEHNEGNNQGV